jgi:hypothetical protein
LVELDRAKIRDIPGQAEEQAKGFNELLSQATDTVDTLHEIFNGLVKHQSSFMILLKERQEAMNRIGVAEGITLNEGLGALAFIPGPWGFSVSLGDDFNRKVLNALLAYKTKLENYKKFLESNPNWLEEDKASKSWMGEPVEFPRFERFSFK